MSKQQLPTLIEQQTQQPPSTDQDSAIAITQNTALADLKLTSKGLFEESKDLWEEFIEFDKAHQLSQRVGAQLWRLTKAVGKPALVLSLKGIQTAIVTVANPENRAALAERFQRSPLAQNADASLETLED